MQDTFIIFDPTIQLSVIDIQDVEYGSSPNYQPTGGETRFSKLAGDYSPFIQINGMKFSGFDIENFILDTSGFIPRLSVSLKEKSGLFASKSFPVDGDLVQLYIKSNNKDFKPIRQDFRVLEVSAGVSLDDKGEINTFSIDAILNLPDLYVDKVKSYSKKTSTDTISEIAKDLKLGFAVNETGLDDVMTRICPYVTYEDFILNDVVPSAYKDDNSFFTAFIDQYYYLNFIEINSLIVHERTLDQVTINFLGHSDYLPDDKKEPEKVISEFFLSNSKVVHGSANHITGYAPLNNSGYVSLKNGYRTYLQYYDKDSADTKQYFIETLNTEGVQDKIILKGRVDEDYTKQVKTANMGFQFNDNVHREFNHAKLQNKYNTDELEKVTLLIDLAGINPMLYKYQIVPIYILNNMGNDTRQQATTTEKDKPDAIDSFLSGFYVVMGIKMLYSSTSKRFYQQIVVTRREYDAPL